MLIVWRFKPGQQQKERRPNKIHSRILLFIEIEKYIRIGWFLMLEKRQRLGIEHTQNYEVSELSSRKCATRSSAQAFPDDYIVVSAALLMPLGRSTILLRNTAIY